MVEDCNDNNLEFVEFGWTNEDHIAIFVANTQKSKETHNNIEKERMELIEGSDGKSPISF